MFSVSPGGVCVCVCVSVCVFAPECVGELSNLALCGSSIGHMTFLFFCVRVCARARVCLCVVWLYNIASAPMLSPIML